MFDQLKNLKEIASLMGNAGELKEKFEQVQDELARKTVEADSGAGAVRVVVSGKLEVISITIDPAMLATFIGAGSDEDRQMVEDLITSATNAALTKARALVQEEMTKAAGGLNLPGIEKMLQGLG